jgi:hypothetical protein
MSFDGRVLERGFWIYVWRVTAPSAPNRPLVYVGRTGDSSSRFAASPFLRIGRHLDFRTTAKANSLARHLKAENIVPADCAFQMIALGPFFEEQQTIELHRPYRDQMAAVECYVAAQLKDRGFKVLGRTNTRKKCPPELLQLADRFLEEHFPMNTEGSP